MKKILMTCAILLVVSTGAQAQGKDANHPVDQVWVTMNTEMLNVELGLNDDQKAKVKEINERFTGRHQEMEAAVPKPTDAEMSTKVAKLMAERDQAMRGVLNDDQYAKWEDKRHKGTGQLEGAEKKKLEQKD